MIAGGRILTFLWLVVGLLAACDRPPADSRLYGVDGDPARGRELALAYGCTACHRMPGLRAPTGEVGPPLHDLPHRAYLAGRLPNQPGNLVYWIMDPPAVDPQTAMPNVGVSRVDALHLVAYLYEAR